MLRRSLCRKQLGRLLFSGDAIALPLIQANQLTSTIHVDTSASPNWAWGIAAAGVLVGSTITTVLADNNPLHPSEDQSFHLMALEQRRKAFFKYEKRIRELSPPEKVFEYFASQGDLHSGFHMTPSDMMRSVVPVYPPAGSDVLRAGSLPGEPSPNMPKSSVGYQSSFLKAFDVDNSGGVTFEEWLVFQSLLSIPDDDVQVAFMLVDTDGSGKICINEFRQLLAAIQVKAAKPTPTLRHTSMGDLTKADDGILTMFFGKDGHGEITLEDFQNFISELREELVRLEFDYYDYEKNGKITGVDFAHSLAGCARLKHVDGYLNKIEAMPDELAKAEMPFDQFCAFRSVWRRLRHLAVALEFYKSSSDKIMPKDLHVIADRVLGVKLPQLQLDILYYLFKKEDGSLNVNFMYAVMDRHFETGLTASYENLKEATGFLTCMQKCAAKGR